MSKIAFVTGGSSGIGQAISKELSSNGWQVIAPTHDELNLASQDEVSDYQLSSTVDVFIHVAGVWHDDNSVLADMPFASFTSEQVSQAVNVGLQAPMLLVNRLLHVGHLSHVIAISGTFQSGAKGWLPYYTSKRALEDFLVGLAQDSKQLKVYGISPADTSTAAYRRFYPEDAKTAQPAEPIAKLALSLVKGEEEYSSGSIIEIRDGKHRLGFHS